MPATVAEHFTSRRITEGNNPGRELVFNVFGTEDQDEAKAALEAELPGTFAGYLLDTYTLEHTGGGVWEANARYRQGEDDSQYTFDTGGGSVKVKQSLQTIASHAPAGETAPDFQGAIGVDKDSVQGVDVTVPFYAFTETHRFPHAFVDATYKTILFALTGRTNDAPFKGLDTGEALLMQVSGSKRGALGDWDLTFRFAGSPNVTGLTIGSMTGINKKGWEYLWVRYEETEDTFSYTLVKRPSAAYVERVYESGDFSQLAIGT